MVPWLVWVLAIVLITMWFGFSWTHGGQTLGMRAWRIRLRAQGASPVTWPQVGIRLVAAPLSLLTGGLGYFAMLWNPHRRTWHDRLSGTEIIRG